MDQTGTSLGWGTLIHVTYFIFFKFFFFLIIIILFIYSGCAGSALLRVVLSSCSRQGLLSSCDAWVSHWGGFAGSRMRGLQWFRFPGPRAQALELWHTGLIAPRHVRSSRIRD